MTQYHVHIMYTTLYQHHVTLFHRTSHRVKSISRTAQAYNTNITPISHHITFISHQTTSCQYHPHHKRMPPTSRHATCIHHGISCPSVSHWYHVPSLLYEIKPYQAHHMHITPISHLYYIQSFFILFTLYIVALISHTSQPYHSQVTPYHVTSLSHDTISRPYHPYIMSHNYDITSHSYQAMSRLPLIHQTHTTPISWHTPISRHIGVISLHIYITPYQVYSIRINPISWYITHISHMIWILHLIDITPHHVYITSYHV